MRKPKRLLACLMALCMVLSLLPVTALAAFDDTDGHWGETAIDRWAGYGVLQGDGAGNFDPDGVMTRGQFASMLVQLMGYTATASNTFTDLPADAWYTPHILKLVAAGVMAGKGDNKADPTGPITREQAARLLCVALNIKPSSAGTGFSDDGSVASWAKGYVAALAERGWISGMPDGTFAPGTDVNRAQAAQMLHGMVGEYVTTNGATVTGDVDRVVIIKANNVTIENATLSDPVIVAPAASNSTVILAGTTKADEVVVEATGAKVVVAEGASAGTVEIAAARASAEVAGTVESVVVDNTATGANVTVDKTGKVESIDTAGYNTTVSVDGTVTDVNVEGKDTTVSVSGTVESVDVAASADGTDIKTTSGAKIKDVTTAADDVTVSGAKGTVDNVTATGDGSTNVQVEGAKVSNEGDGDVKAGNKDVSSGESETVDKVETPSTPSTPSRPSTPSTTEITGVTISGDAIAGQILTANVAPSNASVTYQWEICEAENGKYDPIENATAKTYTVKEEDAGKYIRVTVTASGSTTTGGPASSTPVKVTAANDLTNAVVTLKEGPYIYKGEQHTPEVTKVTLRGEELTVNEDYTVAYGENKNAGENAGTVTITAVADSGYEGTKTVNFDIEKKPISVTINDATVTYGSTPDPEEFSFKLTPGLEGNAMVGSDVLTDVVKMEYGNISVEGKNAGDTVEITGTATSTSDNYEVTVKPGMLTVTKLNLSTLAVVTVTPSDIRVTYTGEDQTKDIITNEVNGVDAGDIELKPADYELSFKGQTNEDDKLLNADTYNITVTGQGNCEGSKEATFQGKKCTVTIEPAKITAVAVKIVKDENGALGPDDQLQVHITTDGPVNNLTGVTYQWLNGVDGDALIADQTNGSITLTGDTAKDNNTIAVKVTLSNNNFEFANSVGESESCEIDNTGKICTVTVGKVGAKKLTIDMVAWDEGTQELVDDDGVPVYPYDGEKKEPGVTVTDGDKAVGSENYTVEYTDKNGAVMDCIDADTYCVKVTGKDGYYGSVGGSFKDFQELTFTINPRPLDLDAENEGKNATVEIDPIESVEYDGKDHTPTVKITDTTVTDSGSDKYVLVEGKDYEVVSITNEDGEDVTETGAINAGTYTITIEGIGNYTGEIKVPFEIDKAEAKAIPEQGELSVEYGKTIPIATVITDFATPSDIKVTFEKKEGAGEVTTEAKKTEGKTESYTVYATGTKVGEVTATIAVDEGTNYTELEASDPIKVTVTAAKIDTVAVALDLSGLEVDAEGNVFAVIKAGEGSVKLPISAQITATIGKDTVEAVEVESVKWAGPDEDTTVDEDGTVTGPGKYTATITVKAKDNYALTEKTTFTLNEEEATAKESSGKYTLTLPVTVTQEIESVAITLKDYQATYELTDDGVTLPTVEENITAKPVKSVTKAELVWTDSEGKNVSKAVKAGTYTGTITVESEEGFTLTEETAISVTAGETPIELAKGKEANTRTFTVKVTGAPSIDLPDPKEGNDYTLDLTVGETKEITVTTDGDVTFSGGDENVTVAKAEAEEDDSAANQVKLTITGKNVTGETPATVTINADAKKDGTGIYATGTFTIKVTVKPAALSVEVGVDGIDPEDPDDAPTYTLTNVTTLLADAAATAKVTAGEKAVNASVVNTELKWTKDEGTTLKALSEIEEKGEYTAVVIVTLADKSGNYTLDTNGISGGNVAKGTDPYEGSFVVTTKTKITVYQEVSSVELEALKGLKEGAALLTKDTIYEGEEIEISGVKWYKDGEDTEAETPFAEGKYKVEITFTIKTSELYTAASTITVGDAEAEPVEGQEGSYKVTIEDINVGPAD